MRVNDSGGGGITAMPAMDYPSKFSPSTADIQAWNNATAGTADGRGGGASTPTASTSPAPLPAASDGKASDDAAFDAKLSIRSPGANNGWGGLGGTDPLGWISAGASTPAPSGTGANARRSDPTQGSGGPNAAPPLALAAFITPPAGNSPPQDNEWMSKVAQDPKHFVGKSVEEIAAEFKAHGFDAKVRQSTKGSGLAKFVDVPTKGAGGSAVSRVEVHPGGGTAHGGAYTLVSTHENKSKFVDPDTYLRRDSRPEKNTKFYNAKTGEPVDPENLRVRGGGSQTGTKPTNSSASEPSSPASPPGGEPPGSTPKPPSGAPPSDVPPRPSGGSAAGSAGMAAEGSAGSSVLGGMAKAARGGGAAGAVVGGGVAAWNDADRVRDGKVTAGRATADVVVQAGVGLGAGAAGAAAGAAVGSVVPVAGTAVGAVVGFGVGMAVGWAADHTGLVDDAEKATGQFLTDHFEQPLQQVWHGVADGVDATRSAVNSGVQTAEHAASDVGNAVSKAWHSLF